MYYHGVINGLVDQKVLNILQDGAIKSATKRNNVNKIGFNENDYISICEYLGEDIYSTHPNNAFHKYILNNFCFVISPDIKVETPILIPNYSTQNPFELIRLRNAHQDQRFSDIIDERQVKDSIPLSKVIAIGIPQKLPKVDGYIKLSSFTFMTLEEYLTFIDKITTYAQNLGIEIFDSSDPTFPLTFEEKNKHLHI